MSGTFTQMTWFMQETDYTSVFEIDRGFLLACRVMG